MEPIANQPTSTASASTIAEEKTMTDTQLLPTRLLRFINVFDVDEDELSSQSESDEDAGDFGIDISNFATNPMQAHSFDSHMEQFQGYTDTARELEENSTRGSRLSGKMDHGSLGKSDRNDLLRLERIEENMQTKGDEFIPIYQQMLLTNQPDAVPAITRFLNSHLRHVLHHPLIEIERTLHAVLSEEERVKRVTLLGRKVLLSSFDDEDGCDVGRLKASLQGFMSLVSVDDKSATEIDRTLKAVIKVNKKMAKEALQKRSKFMWMACALLLQWLLETAEKFYSSRADVQGRWTVPNMGGIDGVYWDIFALAGDYLRITCDPETIDDARFQELFAFYFKQLRHRLNPIQKGSSTRELVEHVERLGSDLDSEILNMDKMLATLLNLAECPLFADEVARATIGGVGVKTLELLLKQTSEEVFDDLLTSRTGNSESVWFDGCQAFLNTCTNQERAERVQRVVSLYRRMDVD